MSDIEGAQNKYYERKNGRMFELCQTRFKGTPDHPRNVCAVATSHEGLVLVYKTYLSGGVDWLPEEDEE